MVIGNVAVIVIGVGVVVVGAIFGADFVSEPDDPLPCRTRFAGALVNDIVGAVVVGFVFVFLFRDDPTGHGERVTIFCVCDEKKLISVITGDTYYIKQPYINY